MGRLENFERYMDKLVDGKEDTVNVLYALRIGASRTEKEALDAAIDAVEQEPCDDVVSRQAVIEMAYDMSEIDGEHFSEPCMVVDVKDIQKLPPVTSQGSEQKTGHWTYICNSEVNGLKIVKCSECGKRTYGSGKYCPNCGAKMESEDKG